MTTAHVGLEGIPPRLEHGKGNPEALKYGRMWAESTYRKVAPGELLAATFLEHARPRAGTHILDFGCGTGRGALMLAILAPGVRVTMLDFVRNSLDPEIREALTTQEDILKFVKHDLKLPIPLTAPYGYCTDVMEHIPPDDIDVVLTNILKAAQHVFFSISTVDDTCGALIGETLHLTVRPYAWWLERFQRLDAVIHFSREEADRCLFYVTAWRTGRDIADAGIVNTEEARVRANVTHNIAQGWTAVHPHAPNDLECMILGGGPSMPAFEAEMKARRADGVKLLTLNGAYNWALDHGLIPSAQIIVDARAFNARFTKPVLDDCKYLLASQCDPSVFEGLPPDRTYLWHTNQALIRDLLDAQYPGGWHAIPGGSTVLLRALPLMRMLGYRKFHLYGCDSCLRNVPDGSTIGRTDLPPQHHAYAQPENDKGLVIPVTLTGSSQIFYCHPWMISQAQELMEMIRIFGSEIELAIHGDGLLAHILETGAKLAREDVLVGITHEEE
jgi:SAM-dependent methyltransferase